MLRSRVEYREKLFDMRANIYIGGEKVSREDARLRPGIRVMDQTFDLAQEPNFNDLFTAKSTITGEKINRWAHLPQNPRDLILKQKMIRVGARRVGGCIQRCMGQDALNALAICTQEIDAATGSDYHKRFCDYLSWYHQNDINGCCAQTDSKGDRLKRPHEQIDANAYVHIVEESDEGILVSGYKMSITQAAYADELFVLPTRALQEEDREFAVAFAIPADAEGVRLVTRPVWMRDKDDTEAAPFDRYGVSDSVIIFDRAFIPKDRVFMCGEWEFGRRLALLFADSHRHSYSGCKPAVSDILCGATLLAAEANNVAKVSHVREKLAEFASAASLAYAAGVSAAVFGKKTDSGVFFPDTVYANVGRRLTGELIYHEYNLLVEVAGGIAATMPFQEDFKVGDNVAHLKKFIDRNPKISTDDAIKIWKFVENLSSSPMAAWYKVAGVHGGGSPIMETIALNIEYDFNDKKELACYLAGIKDACDDSAILSMEPILGEGLS